MFLRLLPAVLSLLVLGAHYLRRGQLVPCGLCVAFALLLGYRNRWVPVLVRVVLVVAALQWVAITIAMVRERAQAGGPTLRLALILGFVTLFTAASAWLVGSRRVVDRYSPPVSPVESA